MSPGRTTPRLAPVLVLVGLGVALWVAPGAWARATEGARTTADEPQYLMTALSLAEDLDLDVSDERAEGRYREFHEVGLPLQEEVRPDGRRVSPHDPLLPLLLTVPIAVGGWLGAKLALAATAGVLAAALVWVAVRRLAVPVPAAVLTVLVFATASPLAVYGTQVYPELPAALAVTLAIGALTGPLGRGGVAVLAATVVALPWLSVKYVPVAAALTLVGLVALVRRDERRRAGVLAGVLAVAGLAFLVAHHALYGGWTAYASGAHFSAGEASVMGADPDVLGRSTRMLGLVVDRGFGLAAWQPAYLLAVPALAAVVRRRPPGWAALALPLAAGWLTATFAALTMHGWWWPGRQVVVVLPAAVLAVAWWAARLRAARWLLPAALAVGAVTVAWLVGEVLLGHRTLIVDFEGTANPLYRAWRLVLPDGLREPGGTDALRALWLAAVALLAAWGWRTETARVASTDGRSGARSGEAPERPASWEAPGRNGRAPAAGPRDPAAGPGIGISREHRGEERRCVDV
ncbi:MAG: hypothetical protein M5U14_18150 [Acidimicrobiia bacterium]|nr:hypothetical protein [Acidimicrobiia bacterium]